MTFGSFQRLSPLTQLYWVLQHGTFLASRFEATAGIDLYHCQDEGRGILVEMGLTEGIAFVVHSFVRSERLEAYVPGMWPPKA